MSDNVLPNTNLDRPAIRDSTVLVLGVCYKTDLTICLKSAVTQLLI